MHRRTNPSYVLNAFNVLGYLVLFDNWWKDGYGRGCFLSVPSVLLFDSRVGGDKEDLRDDHWVAGGGRNWARSLKRV